MVSATFVWNNLTQISSSSEPVPIQFFCALVPFPNRPIFRGRIFFSSKFCYLHHFWIFFFKRKCFVSLVVALQPVISWSRVLFLALLSQAFQHAGVKRGPRQNLIVAPLPHLPPQRLPAPIKACLRAGALGGRGERHVIPLCGSIRRWCRTTCDDSNGYLRGERGPPPPALSDKAERRPSGCTLSRASPSPPTAHRSGYFGGDGGVVLMPGLTSFKGTASSARLRTSLFMLPLLCCFLTPPHPLDREGRGR